MTDDEGRVVQMVVVVGIHDLHLQKINFLKTEMLEIPRKDSIVTAKFTLVSRIIHHFS